MHATRRQRDIMAELRVVGSASIADLAQKLEVSEETIRRNVKVMAENGVVAKVHGGVYLPDSVREATFNQRMNDNRSAKQKIGEAIAGHILDGEMIFLDIGTTTAFVAHALSEHSDLHVVTNSIVIANILACRNGNRIYMAGGELRDHDAGAFGPEAIKFISQFDIQHAVLSTGGLHASKGVLVHHLCEAELLGAVVGRADKVIIGADHSKQNLRAPIRMCEFSDVDLVVTDGEPPEDLREAMREGGVSVEIV